MLRGRSRLFWALVALAAAVVVFYLPSLVAYRYTAASQSASFLTHPWRSWPFLFAAFTVPGDSQLKTSGAAFQRADEMFRGGGVEVDAARLLYLPVGRRYVFDVILGEPKGTAADDLRSAAAPPAEAAITPPFRFVWQIEGRVPKMAGDTPLVVAMLDYRSGQALFDIRGELP
jgi:hypothetical protein